MLVAVTVDWTQQGNVFTWSIADVGKYLIERKKSRPESDFVELGFFKWYAGLLVLRSTH